MRKKSLAIFLPLIFILVFTAACNSRSNAPSAQNGSSTQLERPAPPAEYANLTMPSLSQADLDEGKNLFAKDCSSCHGASGMGDGPVAASLDPKPQPLALTESGLTDGYLFWRISEGGQQKPFSSAMPAWKTILKEQEIWQVIGFLRQLKS